MWKDSVPRPTNRMEERKRDMMRLKKAFDWDFISLSTPKVTTVCHCGSSTDMSIINGVPYCGNCLNLKVRGHA